MAKLKTETRGRKRNEGFDKVCEYLRGELKGGEPQVTIVKVAQLSTSPYVVAQNFRTCTSFKELKKEFQHFNISVYTKGVGKNGTELVIDARRHS